MLRRALRRAPWCAWPPRRAARAAALADAHAAALADALAAAPAVLQLIQMLFAVCFLVVCEQAGQLKLHMALVMFVSSLSVLMLCVLLLFMQLQRSQPAMQFVNVVMRRRCCA